MVDFPVKNPLVFPSVVPAIEEDDLVLGGIGNGPNVALQPLVDRTDFLKDAVDDFVANSQNLVAGTDYVAYTAFLQAVSGTSGNGLLRKTGNATSTVVNWIDPSVACGRLTLATGVPFDNTDTTGDRIFYTPYTGNTIALLSSGEWRYFTFAQIDFPLAGIAAATNVDIFAVPSGNSAILQISAWSTNTARTDLLTRSNGVWVQASNTSRRYLGTIRTSATATGADTETQRYVWNVSNQLPKILRRQDNTATWTYSLGTWRRMNNSSANRVEVVAGLAENTIDVQILGVASNNAQVAIGVSSETVPVTTFGYGQADGAQSTSIGSRIQAQLSPGYNFLQALERSQAGSTSTFLGPTIALSGRWLC